jgi:hypothetical protein
MCLAVTLTLCASCLAPNSRSVSTKENDDLSAGFVRTPAQQFPEDDFYAKSAAFDFGNRYCTYFKTAETKGAAKEVIEAETRVYKVLCSSPESMFSPLATFSGKTRYAAHMLLLQDAFVQLEKLNQDANISRRFSTLRTQIQTQIELLGVDSQDSSFRNYVIKERLVTTEGYEKFWDNLKAQVALAGKAIRHSELGSSTGFIQFSAANKWPNLTVEELECIKTDPRFEKSYDFVCTKNRSELSAPYKTYLDFKRQYIEVLEAYQNESGKVERLKLDQKIRTLERDWVVGGFKMEGDTHYRILEIIRERCSN